MDIGGKPIRPESPEKPAEPSLPEVIRGRDQLLRNERAEKRDHRRARHVICGEEIDHRDHESSREVVVESRSHNSVFTPESSQGRTAGQRQGSYQKGPERDRHVLLQPAHLPDVLLVMQTDESPNRRQGKAGP